MSVNTTTILFSSQMSRTDAILQRALYQLWEWFDALLFCCRIRTECWVEMSLLKGPSVILGSFNLSVWALQTLGFPSHPLLHRWLCIDNTPVPWLFINWCLH